VDSANNFGIGVIGGSDNVLDQNTMSGNTHGLFITAAARNVTVRGNVIVGNAGIQAQNTRPDQRHYDIMNLAPTGQAVFERNVCHTSVNAPCPTLAGGPQ
jgi:parallel beta-helix repeat protein